MSGGGQADTIDAILAQRLGVLALGSDGHAASGARIGFFGGDFVLVSNDENPTFIEHQFTATDSAGHAEINVRLGPNLGAGSVIAVGTLNTARDTVYFQILAGAPAHVQIQPLYSLVTVGARQEYSGLAVDRHEHVLPTLPLWSSPGSIASMNSTQATALSPGLARIVARAGAIADTALLGVVPEGTMVWTSGGMLRTAKLDGSGQDSVLFFSTTQASYWLADGSILAFDLHELVRVRPRAATSPFLTALPNGVTQADEPTVSADGQRVYFRGYRPATHTYGLYQTDQLGGVAVELHLPDSEFGMYSVAPDGVRVAYALPATGTAAIVDLNTGTRAILPFPTIAPRWSPVGDLIAVAAGLDHGILLYSPTGQLLRKIVPSRIFVPCCLSWSPDGRFLVVEEPGRLDLIDVATEDVIQLPFTQGGWDGALRIP